MPLELHADLPDLAGARSCRSPSRPGRREGQEGVRRRLAVAPVTIGSRPGDRSRRGGLRRRADGVPPLGHGPAARDDLRDGTPLAVEDRRDDAEVARSADPGRVRVALGREIEPPGPLGAHLPAGEGQRPVRVDDPLARVPGRGVPRIDHVEPVDRHRHGDALRAAGWSAAARTPPPPPPPPAARRPRSPGAAAGPRPAPGHRTHRATADTGPESSRLDGRPSSPARTPEASPCPSAMMTAPPTSASDTFLMARSPQFDQPAIPGPLDSELVKESNPASAIEP